VNASETGRAPRIDRHEHLERLRISAVETPESCGSAMRSDAAGLETSSPDAELEAARRSSNGVHAATESSEHTCLDLPKDELTIEADGDCLRERECPALPSRDLGIPSGT
jgi:hypothetical protein